MMPKQITISILHDGTARIDLAGFHGQGCAEIAQSFGQGQQLLEETVKPEFYEEPETIENLETL
jgi:hypothetical protein